MECPLGGVAGSPVPGRKSGSPVPGGAPLRTGVRPLHESAPPSSPGPSLSMGSWVLLPFPRPPGHKRSVPTRWKHCGERRRGPNGPPTSNHFVSTGPERGEGEGRRPDLEPRGGFGVVAVWATGRALRVGGHGKYRCRWSLWCREGCCKCRCCRWRMMPRPCC